MTRGRLFTVIFSAEHWQGALDFTQLCNSITDAPGQLFYRLDTAAGALAQLLAQEQLRLSEHACQRIINLMAHVRN